MDKFQLNAALSNLVCGEDIESSAQYIIDNISSFPETGSIQYLTRTGRSDGPSITGETGSGMYTIKPTSREPEIKEYNHRYIRVGSFKIWRWGSAVCFAHYLDSNWPINIPKEDKQPTGEYVVQMNPKKKTFRYLGIWKCKILLRRFGKLYIHWLYVEVVHGEPRRWPLRSYLQIGTRR